jgi:uncharacterized protein YbjQ (UPF0145 family)
MSSQRADAGSAGLEAAFHQAGLPEAAARRVAEQHRGGAWTSDLSVQELAAIRSVGFVPVGQVMGSSIYQINWRGYVSCQIGWGFTASELGPYTQALRDVRETALHRMRLEAWALGAHGVVGVHLNLRTFPEAARAIEFTAIGTAVRCEGAEPLATPFTSALSGQDFARLLHAGMVPVGLVMGLSTIHVHTGWSARLSMGSWSNTEIEDFTAAVSGARGRAIARLVEDAARMGADGAVGSQVSLQVWRVPCGVVSENEDHIVQFSALSTAVAAFTNPERTPPRLLMRLDDRAQPSTSEEFLT